MFAFTYLISLSSPHCAETVLTHKLLFSLLVSPQKCPNNKLVEFDFPLEKKLPKSAKIRHFEVTSREKTTILCFLKTFLVYAFLIPSKGYVTHRLLFSLPVSPRKCCYMPGYCSASSFHPQTSVFFSWLDNVQTFCYTSH